MTLPAATQTRLGSLIEACMNIVIGYGIALISQLVLFPRFNIDISFGSHLAVTYHNVL